MAAAVLELKPLPVVVVVVVVVAAGADVGDVRASVMVAFAAVGTDLGAKR